MTDTNTSLLKIFWDSSAPRRVYTSRLATKERYGIFHRGGDDFGLIVSAPKSPNYLLIANGPEMESIIGTLNALILNRLVTCVNTGLGMQKIISTVGNVASGSARAKGTLEWLSSNIFGKVVQLKKGVTIDCDKTSINLNENMDSRVPASKISDMTTGWICGQTAHDFVQTKVGVGSSMNIQESNEFKTSKFFCKTDFNMAEIKKEESEYVPLSKFYTFKSRDERERILYKNFVQVSQEVKAMIADISNIKNAIRPSITELESNSNNGHAAQVKELAIGQEHILNHNCIFVSDNGYTEWK